MSEFTGQLWLNAQMVSLRAACGMAGATLLIIALPPRGPNAKIDRVELLYRVFAGAILPVFMGPWALAFLRSRFDYLLLHEFPELIFFTLGSVSYFLFRSIAIFLNRNKDRAITDIDFGRRWDDSDRRSDAPPPYIGPERRASGREHKQRSECEHGRH